MATTAAAHDKSSKTILLTGASGFVAAHVLHAFLSAGYHVRGTVRSQSSAEHVRASHSQYPASQLSFAIVPDITTPGAFDEAVKGVHGVIHTASPFVMSVKDNETDLLDPAIKGTTNILTSIAAHAPAVHRVVITSSFAANIDLSKGLWPGHVYTEEDWNPVTYAEAKATDNGAAAYCASKTFAERAAFEFVHQHNPNFSIVTLCPPMVYGPNAHYVKDLAGLNTSSADIYRLMNGSEKEVPPNSFYAFVDVRDLAEAHKRAYETPAAGGRRYLISGGGYVYQDIVDVIRKEVPEARKTTPEGKPGDKGPAHYTLSTQEAQAELGVRFRSLDTTIGDTARDLWARMKKEGKA